MNKKLADKQRRFCQEYIVDLNATQAAIRAGYRLRELSELIKIYYVYMLIDPRNNEIFYIGKGKGKRALMHERNARNGVSINWVKGGRIIEILKTGASPQIVMFYETNDESDAFEIERYLIKRFKEYLTNKASGTVSCKEHAKILLSKIIPFDKWVCRRKPTEKEIEYYKLVCENLKVLSERGNNDTLEIVYQRRAV